MTWQIFWKLVGTMLAAGAFTGLCMYGLYRWHTSIEGDQHD